MMRISILLAVSVLLSGCHHQANYIDGCGTLPANWITPRHGRGVLSVLSVISVASDGTIRWNGVKVSEALLGSYLKQLGTMNPLPVTQVKFEPDVHCVTVVRLRQLMSETLDCSYGKCAEGRGRWWEIGDVPPFPTYDPHPELPQDQ